MNEKPKYITSNTSQWHHLKPFAREHRKDPTYAEKLVWNFVRNKQLGVRIRRQHAIADFIVDFVCLEKSLIIEIDGDSHTGKEEYDAWRTSILNELGYRVIRFTDEDVKSKGEWVEQRIREELAL
ncbi:MAG: endonuclease domain-containing protein [Candidatus Kapaibacterium sp.]